MSYGGEKRPTRDPANLQKAPEIRGLAASAKFFLGSVCRAAREYLVTLDDAAFGAASDSIPKFVSPSDPAAACPLRAPVHCRPGRCRRAAWKRTVLVGVGRDEARIDSKAVAANQTVSEAALHDRLK